MMIDATNNEAVTNQKSLALKAKGLIGHSAWRIVTRPVAWVLMALPTNLLYRLGVLMRENSYPYSLIKEGDIAIQVGAPRDLLRIGRSRAVYFAMMVGQSGRVYIFEPEPNSARAMQEFLSGAGLSDRTRVVSKGCWSSERVLRFWSNPNHPASNLLEDVSEWSEAELRARGYEPSEVPVTKIDAIMKAEGVEQVKLISVTTNGSEEEILKGANTTLGSTDYLALADTGPEIHALSEQYGFRNIALDDRGFTSARK